MRNAVIWIMLYGLTYTVSQVLSAYDFSFFGSRIVRNSDAVLVCTIAQ